MLQCTAPTLCLAGICGRGIPRGEHGELELHPTKGDPGQVALQSRLQSSSTCFSGTRWLLSARVFPQQAQPPQIAHKF